jgi:hypothetical protein
MTLSQYVVSSGTDLDNMTILKILWITVTDFHNHRSDQVREFPLDELVYSLITCLGASHLYVKFAPNVMVGKCWAYIQYTPLDPECPARNTFAGLEVGFRGTFPLYFAR